MWLNRSSFEELFYWEELIAFFRKTIIRCK